ncbi:hypothetical protein NKH14_16655 [Mesorhizobium sp. M1380]|uniref:hypothetical protein n=1 Tax=Mesorhizobium sp. M1380 TaxID=2957093 RepID=UPI00333AD27E
MKPTPPAEQHDFLADNNAYAGLSNTAKDGDDSPLGHLLNMREKLVTRRRQFAADAKNNTVVYMGRSIDICKLQKLIRAVDEAIADERGSNPA